MLRILLRFYKLHLFTSIFKLYRIVTVRCIVDTRSYYLCIVIVIISLLHFLITRFHRSFQIIEILFRYVNNANNNKCRNVNTADIYIERITQYVYITLATIIILNSFYDSTILLILGSKNKNNQRRQMCSLLQKYQSNKISLALIYIYIYNLYYNLVLIWRIKIILVSLKRKRKKKEK